MKKKLTIEKTSGFISSSQCSHQALCWSVTQHYSFCYNSTLEIQIALQRDIDHMGLERIALWTC